MAYLVDSGADIEALDAESRTPLIAAALGGQAMTARLLLGKMHTLFVHSTLSVKEVHSYCPSGQRINVLGKCAFT